MKISIRKFLLFNLLLAIIATTALTTIGNYYLEKKDLQQHLDVELSQSALSFQALIGDDISQKSIDRVQKELDRLPAQEAELAKLAPEKEDILSYAGKYQFQVWNQQGALLLQTPGSPDIPLSDGSVGFSDKDINGDLWRVFTLYNQNLNVTIVAAERYDLREKLSQQITKDYLSILLITYPLSGFLIWFIIGKGLNSINQVTREVANRVPNYLEPVALEMIPVEIKPLIDELNKLFLRLQQAFDREKRFAADAAHELKTPLAALRAQAEVALKSQNEMERQISLKNLISCVDRSAHVVQQLLTLSRIVPEVSYEKEMVRVDLNRIATEIIAHLAPIAIAREIEIQFFPHEKPIYLKANPTMLGTLIQNLVDNAIRYTPDHGEVNIVTRVDSSKGYLIVDDNGPGIPSEYRARVFERFFRIFGTEKPGSGLGLAIVSQIAELHHAEIKLGVPPNGKGLEVEVSFNKLNAL